MTVRPPLIIMLGCALCILYMLVETLRVKEPASQLLPFEKVIEEERKREPSPQTTITNTSAPKEHTTVADSTTVQCPDKYLFVNTRTWGRHHNQLQSFLFGIVASKLLNRTFILGHFRHNHGWLETTDTYDWTNIQHSYCVKHPTDKSISLQSRDMECFGQDVRDTPFGKHRKLKCKNFNSQTPKHFTRFVFQEVVPKVFKELWASTSKLVVLSGQVAFYLRPGLRLLKPVFAKLQPSADVGGEVSRYVQTVFEGRQFIALHVRAREGQCQEEITADYTTPSTKMYNVTKEIVDTLAGQCGITPEVLKRFRTESGIKPAFFASDHQNPSLDQAFVAASAIPYKGRFHTNELGGLKGLAVDYFILRSSSLFIGNTISSVSQDVCYARLSSMPFSRACAGWNEDLIAKSLSVTTGYYKFLFEVGAVKGELPH
eukprot:TRINITY_DN18424_c0_g1_i1.p1 TRINITY_DN18424_c0_g1~~TRINITY_DN18424_c0_g1_i1.p1  ORF type:complete len:430 (+),score=55.84 TRINITY_DN18424_c0_g1_i1:97-1386(+)